jgi:glyoxylase-like metal-dependent hydrolase (beta-lactamase superfamily II)
VLTPVDRVEVTVVIDNFLDVLMAGEEGVVRYQARDFGAAEQLVAEHGFSALVSVERDGDRRTVLHDAGLTPHAVARNLDVLQVRVGDLRAIVISHGPWPVTLLSDKFAGFRSNCVVLSLAGDTYTTFVERWLSVGSGVRRRLADDRPPTFRRQEWPTESGLRRPSINVLASSKEER